MPMQQRLKKQTHTKIDWMTIIIVVGLVAFGLISLSSIMATPFSGTESSPSDYLEKLNFEYV